MIIIIIIIHCKMVLWYYYLPCVCDVLHFESRLKAHTTTLCSPSVPASLHVPRSLPLFPLSSVRSVPHSSPRFTHPPPPSSPQLLLFPLHFINRDEYKLSLSPFSYLSIVISCYEITTNSYLSSISNMTHSGY